jgi:hypothetical protein
MVLKLRVPELSLTPMARFNCDPLLSNVFAAPSEVVIYKAYVAISRAGVQYKVSVEERVLHVCC